MRKSLVQELFGKRYKDLTKEEYLEYHRVKNSDAYRRARLKQPVDKSGSLCYQMYGTTARALTPEQKREYNKIMKRKERERKNAISTGDVWEEA